ncbi:Glycoside hydrolase superfamily [Macrophomina phaseolina MS6]|uniref:Glycoside hydrolase superfamily n=1 Tax=Macrophomina phaseolina (strain MS6) TaxID=1126212 RepID=K2QJ96_MACPH|nr:Glycoside hydrolase superfamily [Macrophomina phaseolina MS6]
MPLITGRLACALLFLASSTSGNGESTIKLDVPAIAPVKNQIIDSRFFSHSIELSYLVDYAGNLTHPNTLSNNLIRNLYLVTGSYPIVRVGGSTQNHATWVQNQTEAIVLNFSDPSADQPDNVTLGPAFLESFKTFPDGTQYIFGLNFFDGEIGKQDAVLEARNVYQSLKDRLYAFEIGNEFDGFPVNRSRETWSLEAYVEQWLYFAGTISGNVSIPKPFFQAGVFATLTANPDIPQIGNTPWTAETAIDHGITGTGQARTFTEHTYIGVSSNSSLLPPVPLPSLDQNLLNHTFLAHHMEYFVEQSRYSVAHGLPYVIGETNSLASQGLQGVSNVFGAALWSIGYALYTAAATNVSRLHFHNGTPYRYSVWQPVTATGATNATNATTPAHARPLYYGNMFVANALGNPRGHMPQNGSASTWKVAFLVEEARFTAYAVFSVAQGAQTLRHIALVNMDGRWSADPAKVGKEKTVKLPEDSRGAAEVRRLTGAAVDLAQGVTWAGRTVDPDGNLVGMEVVERVQSGGEVTVQPGEAVLLSF